jgi:hypothetical protein
MKVIELPMDTGYLRPHAEAMAELLRIVQANEWIDLRAVKQGPFGRAMEFVGRCFRLDQPSTKYYLSGWVDYANDYMDRCGLFADIDGDSLLAAVIAASDVPYRLPDGRYGQVAELALDRFSGKKTTNAWRLLKGSPLRPPLAPRLALKLPAGRVIPRPRVFQEDSAGVMREVDHESLRWSR